MDSAKLHEWLQIIGLVAVVGSLIFVGLQVKQADEIAFAELSESATASGIERRALIAEHAEIWHKACLGSELTEAERVIAGAIYSNYVHSNYNFWIRLEETGVGGVSSRFLTDRFAANIYWYPGFRSMAQSRAAWTELSAPPGDGSGVERYGSAIRDRVVELFQLDPNPNADVMWCGMW